MRTDAFAKFLSELSALVADSATPARNTGAERSVLAVVAPRKVSGSTRSAAAVTTFTRLATWWGTRVAASARRLSPPGQAPALVLGNA